MWTAGRFLGVLLAGCLACGAALAQKAFVHEEIATEAVTFEAVLHRTAAPDDRPLADIRRDARILYSKGDVRGALPLFESAARASPANAGVWVELSIALLAVQEPDWQERANILQRASAAAYIGYRRAVSPEAEAIALAQLGRTLARRELWRPALDSLKISLDTTEEPTLRTLYDQLRAQHGFRILDTSVDADTASPRACIEFSEDLAKGRIDFSPFVALGTGEAPAVSAEGRQLCLEGLRHGSDHVVTVRSGLPSAVGETLLKPAELAVYIRDRSPAVRFTGRAYVLPRTAQRGVPLVSVNADAVEAEILRIGDRSLARAVAGGEFQRAVDGDTVERIATETGARVWKGEMPVENRLNEEVTTALPVQEAVGRLAPGVYLMVAWVKDRKPELYEQLATQWFIVSDLGLSAFSGPDGVTAFVRSLATAEPLAGVELRLLAKNDEILAATRSDSDGTGRFAAGLTRGTGGSRPALLVAARPDGDYAFLSLEQPAFDLADRGVAGRPSPGPLDAHVFTERGVYRPGETVHLTAILRDDRARAVEGLPLTLVVLRPDGVEYRRRNLSDQGLGGRVASIDLLAGALTGTWRARLFADPNGAPVGEATFLVEDYLPERLSLELTPEADALSAGDPVPVNVEGRYLFGAPAAALALEGEVAVLLDESDTAGLPGYRFGLSDEPFSPVRRPLSDLPATDGDGRARIVVGLPPLPDTTRPLKAEITLRLIEPSGRSIERKLSLPVRTAKPRIGVKPLFAEDRVRDGGVAEFEVVAIGPDGARQSRPVSWELSRIETRYQWYRRDGTWDYEAATSARRVGDGTLDLDSASPARLSAPVEWGRYRLDVFAPGGERIATSVEFTSGFFASASADTPDTLEIALERKEYRTGDTARIRLAPTQSGKAHVAVYGDRLVASRMLEVGENGAVVDLPVGEDWGAGAYVVASHYRPLDEAQGRMPGRAIGVGWISVDRAARTLDVVLGVPAEAAPGTRLDVPIRIGGLGPDQEARVVVAAVDVGILNLTGYQPPAPDEWFGSQRRLAADIRDLYGQLIDGMRAERGQIRSGGDTAPVSLQGSPPVEAPLALFSGMVRAGPDGVADVAFDLPAFNGTVRIMAVAWSRSKSGHAVRDVLVRDPVVIAGALPRFLSLGDESRLRIDLANVTGPPGPYTLSLGVEGPVAVGGSLTRAIELGSGARSEAEFPLAAQSLGTARLTATLAAPDGAVFERTYAVTVLPAVPEVSRTSRQTLAANGGRLSVGSEVLAGFLPGSGRVALSAGPLADFDVPSLLLALDRYPFGCSEQITSRALPLLYLSELGGEEAVALGGAVEDRIQGGIDRILGRQDSSGSFGLWSVGGSDIWLDAYVTDFLSRAREKGFQVPELALKLALDRLRNHLNYAPEITDGGGADIAYALYVLARNGRALAGDLRYFADAKLSAFGGPLPKAQLGAALALVGERGRAERAFTAALADFQDRSEDSVRRDVYGSRLRDGAALLTLVADSGIIRASVPGLAATVIARRQERTLTSTQENAWLVLAARSLLAEAGRMELEVDGAPHRGQFARTLDAGTLGNGPTVITNRSGTPLSAVVTVTGYPSEPEPPIEKGFAIERRFYSLAGEEVDISRVRQNERLVVVLTVTEPEVRRSELLLVDRLPAGLEVENPRLAEGAGTRTLAWLPENAGTKHTEFRDDRFAAAFERNPGDPVRFSVAYMVRAVSPGRFVHPPVTVEDMYRPERFARSAQGVMEVTRGP